MTEARPAPTHPSPSPNQRARPLPGIPVHDLANQANLSCCAVNVPKERNPWKALTTVDVVLKHVRARDDQDQESTNFPHQSFNLSVTKNFSSIKMHPMARFCRIRAPTEHSRCPVLRCRPRNQTPCDAVPSLSWPHSCRPLH